ncbi:unnamed protein product [Cuscuta europaea]|uniref:DUF4005 domain-containing protein n=1 Tax=Cuscuta europaea TaxID=41803 RepID=A0A9P1E9G5_CUSEU|nr:unnamed protein product [Cuscuta europaea]
MKKAKSWLKSLLGMKKDSEYSDDMKMKRRWSFGRRRLTKEEDSAIAVDNEFPVVVVDSPWLVRSYYVPADSEKQNKHAVALAAARASAAVAELTGGQGKGDGMKREMRAAIKVQTFFRGFLARKALRALKGIVKLQALVRGYLVRKRAAATLYCMEALIRAQAAARSERARRRLSSISTNSDSRTYKKSSRTCWRSSTDISDSGDDHYLPPCLAPGRLSIPDDHRRRLCDSEWRFLGGKECNFPASHITPRRTRPSGRRSPPPTLAPAKVAVGDCPFRPYPGSPSYMANTESFNAKRRSQSAPKPRPEPVRLKKRFSLSEMMTAKSSFIRGGGGGVRMPPKSPCYFVQEEYCYLGF